MLITTVLLELLLGDVLLWNGSLFHAAMHNTDDKPRIVLLYSFVHESSGVIQQRTPEFRTGRSAKVGNIPRASTHSRTPAISSEHR